MFRVTGRSILSRSSLFYECDVSNDARQRAARPTVVHAPLSAGVQSYAFMVFFFFLLCRYHTIDTCYNTRFVLASSGCTSTILQILLITEDSTQRWYYHITRFVLYDSRIFHCASRIPNTYYLAAALSIFFIFFFFLFALVTIRSRAIVAWFPLFTFMSHSRSFSRSFFPSPSSPCHCRTHTGRRISEYIVFLFLPLFSEFPVQRNFPIQRNFHSITKKKTRNEEKRKIALSLWSTFV